ncbi:MAG: sigma-54 dependent transcriptional regulator [Ghiorsea sp.]|nr:sigma-54 dependent transcriptional regulator [Ghiorsea sp.]
MTIHILIVDDEQPIRESLQGLFEDEGYLVSTAPSGEEAVARFRKHPVDCIFLDIWMPGIDGLETMSRIKQMDADVPVIMMSGHATIDTAVRATKLGAFDFIEKPFASEKLLILLRNAIEKRRLATENFDLRQENSRVSSQLIGDSPVIQEVRKAIKKASMKDTPVMIVGEHGTGKSIVARLLHEASQRQGKPYIVFHPGTLSEEDVRHELFGYEKGAFVGALYTQRGRLEAAHEGVIYFEEITQVPLSLQQCLLQAIQEKRVQRQGNQKQHPCDVRLIMSSCCTQDILLSSNALLPELYAKMNGTTICMPKLKDRLEDIPALLTFLAQEQVESLGGEPVTFSDDVIALLRVYDWPGNIRELRNYVERCHILCSGQMLTVENMLPLDASQQKPSFAAVPDDSVLMDGFHDARKQFERSYIIHHLEKNDWNVSKTAADIGMERSQLHRKIKSHDLTPPNK